MAPASSVSAIFNPLLVPTLSPACHSHSSSAPLRLSNVRVLVVGAGGIGCEVCKDLLLSGFRRLCVVDLDTIDVSNLNRQFFFRNAHVGLSKAFVLAAACSALLSPTERQALARKRARALRQLQQTGEVDSEGEEESEENNDGKPGPDADGQAPLSEAEGVGEREGDVCIDGRTVWGVVGQKMNILSSDFTIQLLQTYDVVISALDNQKARRHLNGLCIAADLPLIEAGSTGYSGQVMPILKNETLCYDCEAKPRDQQRFPVCTLRQRPERPEHCIAWAKMIYELVFGVEDNENLLSDLKEQLRTFLDVSSTAEAEGREDETSLPGTHEKGAGEDSAGTREEAMRLMSRKMMKELFHDQIVDLLRLSQENKEAMKKQELLPTPLCVQGLTDKETFEASHCRASEDTKTTNKGPKQNAIAPTENTQGEGSGLESQRTWSVQECQEVFERSFLGLLERQKTTERENAGTGKREAGIPFDKDDDLAMDFVAAAANLRMHNFHIALKSRWFIQAVAGSIIPAIAATNAVVAALQVVQLFHLLQFLHSEGRLRHQRREAPQEENEKRKPVKTLRSDSNCRYVWVKPFVTGVRPDAAGRLILPEVVDPPRASCFLCQQQTVTIELASLSAWNIETFVERIVKGELGLAHPYLDSESRNLYDVDEVDEQREDGTGEGEASPLKQPLTNFGIVSGTILTATDFSRGDFQCNLLILERSELGEKNKDDPHIFRLVRESGASSTAEKETQVSQGDKATAEQKTQEPAARKEDQKGDNLEDDNHVGRNRQEKRPRDETSQATSAERQTLGNAADVEIVVLDDQEHGESPVAYPKAKKRKEVSPSCEDAEIIIDDDDE
ncbi:ThiF family protein [Toxoplasma gondii p89]|uniref:ThiF family protein n=2 Tax=Toxoplasma gondii TaxID=5811 RepID=A0A086J957_TOXGO|nr:ThiF family protein [Toxoplasma gondii p89]